MMANFIRISDTHYVNIDFITDIKVKDSVVYLFTQGDKSPTAFTLQSPHHAIELVQKIIWHSRD